MSQKFYFLLVMIACLAGVEKAIALDPNYAEAHLNRGVAYGQLKRHDEAIAAFDRALRLNPNLPNAWLGIQFYLWVR